MRKILSLLIVLTVIVAAFTIDLGGKTFAQHVARIWKADETQDLVDGVKDASGPLANKLKRGAEAGWEAMQDKNAGKDAGPDKPTDSNNGAATDDSVSKPR